MSPYSTRHRAHFNFDSRTQTAYGTLRTYVAVNVDNQDQNTVTVSPTRAFIQWAGFTFGHTKSFTDVPGTPGDDTFKSLFQTQNQSDTGANGTNQIAYTWELGNGMTLNVGADERRTKGIGNLSNNVTTVGANPNTAFGPYQHPTPWVNFAVNQAWGRFGVSAIFNKVNATYYTGTATGPAAARLDRPAPRVAALRMTSGAGRCCRVSTSRRPGLALATTSVATSTTASARPLTRAAATLNSPGLFGSGNTVAIGVISDGVFVNGGQFELTTTWTAGAGYEHFWLPNFSTAVYGTYTQVRYNDTVINRSLVLRRRWWPEHLQTRVAGATPASTTGPWALCTNWYPVAGFRLAVDVQYTRIETAFDGQTVTLGKTQGLRPTGSLHGQGPGHPGRRCSAPSAPSRSSD